MTPRVPVSVVIPAHDEEQVIGRCLRALSREARPDELEIVVVCNGCSDDTAAAARAAHPDAIVLELPTASKSAALNAGDARATRFPRFYVDADVELSIWSLRATAAALELSDALCAAPIPDFRRSDRPWTIRKFYDVWEQLPYLNDRVVGNGVYALSAEGRARFDSFPDITADDQFVLQQFETCERVTTPSHRFTVHPPSRLSSLVRIRARAYRGTQELAASGLARHAATGGAGRALQSLLRRPRKIPGVAVYVSVAVAGRVSAQLRRHDTWERDDTARGLVHETSEP